MTIAYAIKKKVQFPETFPQRTIKYLHAAIASSGDMKEINCGAFAE